jgi:hypothetical protein
MIGVYIESFFVWIHKSIYNLGNIILEIEKFDYY